MNKKLMSVIASLIMTMSMSANVGAEEAKVGWSRSDGQWYYRDGEGNAPAEGMTEIGGCFYEFDESGRWTGKLKKSSLYPEDFSFEYRFKDYESDVRFVFDGSRLTMTRGSRKVSKRLPPRCIQVIYSMLTLCCPESGEAHYLEDFYRDDEDNFDESVWMYEVLYYCAGDKEVLVEGDAALRCEAPHSETSLDFITFMDFFDEYVDDLTEYADTHKK